MTAKPTLSFERGGLLLIDKPAGITSHDLVARVRKILRLKQVGHAGTLDPLATGLMIVLVGKATRLAHYLQSAEKSYTATFRFGFDSDTWDRDGKVEEVLVQQVLTKDKLVQLVTGLQGQLMFPVPPISAVKVDGKKLYQYSRAGETVPEVRRAMTFWDARLTRWSPDIREGVVDLHCSKGSFIRSWVRELGNRAEAPALIWELRRQILGPFKVADGLTLEALEALPSNGDWSALGASKGWRALDNCLPDWPQIALTGRWIDLVVNGQIPEAIREKLSGILVRIKDSGRGVRLVNGANGDLLALVQYLPGGPGLGRLAVVFGASSTVDAEGPSR